MTRKPRDEATSSNPQPATSGDGGPVFTWAPQPPGAQPVTDPKKSIKRKPPRHLVKPPPTHPVPAWDDDTAKILQEDWSADYQKCKYFSSAWDQTHANDGTWPTPEYKLLKGKLYFLERLCVPTDRIIQVIDGHHRWNAHQGEDRLLPDLFLHYLFPTEVDVAETLSAIKKILSGMPGVPAT